MEIVGWANLHPSVCIFAQTILALTLAVDIEDMTMKTGNFKKFLTFVRMLGASMTMHSETVFIDLLTYADLELLKARKMGRPLTPSEQAAMLKQNNKRYVILTYVAEFDKSVPLVYKSRLKFSHRVYYPLPLRFDTNPDPQLLRATISRLRSELDQVRSSHSHEPLASHVRTGL